MQESTSALPRLLADLRAEARRRGLSDAQWAARAGVRKETLSRLAHRGNCDLGTLEALGRVVNIRLALAPPGMDGTRPGGHFPGRVDRDYEERLVRLCASRSLDVDRWRELGPAFFMAGLAVALASRRGFDRRGLLALAEELHPGAGEPQVFERWLHSSPLRPTRFFSLLDAATRDAA
jgi:DNA-binding phage protein